MSLKQTDHITSTLHENRIFPPAKDFSAGARIKTPGEYEKLYLQSIESPETFWAEQAEAELDWFKKWPGETFSYHPERIGASELPYLQFFAGGKLNASYNCLDRHAKGAHKNKTAIIWQGEAEEDKRHLSYLELLNEVSRFANVLKKRGVKRGTVVTIFMPMVPEIAVAMLACARIGAVHSVVFSAFSAEALRSRVNDGSSEVVITSDVSFHNGKILPQKEKVDAALEHCPTVKTVLVFKRGAGSVTLKSGRDFWWHEEISAPDISNECAPAEQDAEDPLFMLYTSGSTGKPKGVLHTTAGYLLFAHLTTKYVFDLQDSDIFWCTADCGWITGHSYLVYGPLSNGATCVMYESTPTYPEPDRFWKIIADYRVSVFYTAPTAIRALMRLGEEWPRKHDLSSLRLLGTVGEPINPEAWIWYQEQIGEGRCPIVDTWWQTETGGIMITTLPGALSTKPGSAGKPFFGIQTAVLRDDGSVCDTNEGGSLVLTKPWPGMLRGVYGDKTGALIKQVYFLKFDGLYFTGDGCRVDENGYHWLLGRIDDVLNVSAHRLSTAEIESALVSHHSVAEAAVVGFPHETKGQGIYCFVTLKAEITYSEELRQTLTLHVRQEISPIATPDVIHFAPALPKTRSGKIMRRVLRKIAAGDTSEMGDTSTLADPTVVEQLLSSKKERA